jgi:hypothetical protein
VEQQSRERLPRTPIGPGSSFIRSPPAWSRLLSTKQRELRLVIGRLDDFAGTVRDSLQQVEWETRRTIIRRLVKRVEIDLAEIRIIFRIGSEPSNREGQAAVLSDWRRRAQANKWRTWSDSNPRPPVPKSGRRGDRRLFAAIRQYSCLAGIRRHSSGGGRWRPSPHTGEQQKRRQKGCT